MTSRQCADHIGFTTEWIRQAILVGVSVRGGMIVKLEAEILDLNHRRRYWIRDDAFRSFLEAIGWKRKWEPTTSS